MAKHGYGGEGYGGRGDYDDRDRQRGGDRDRMMFRDEDEDYRARGRDEQRGFFERAAAWFRDDEDDERERWRGRSERTPQGWGTPTPEDERYRRAQGAWRDHGDDDRDEWLGGRERGRGDWQDRGDSFGTTRSSSGAGWSGDERGDESLGYGSALGSSLGGFGNQESARPARRRFGSSQDDHYRSWRDRQIEALDRDYEDYCREREQRFHEDFDSWRKSRPQGQSGGQRETPVGASGEGGLMLSGSESGDTGRPDLASGPGGGATASQAVGASGPGGGATGGGLDSAQTGGTQVTGEKIGSRGTRRGGTGA